MSEDPAVYVAESELAELAEAGIEPVPAPSGLAQGLRQSAQNRLALVKRFGFVPMSVLRGIGRGGLSRELFLYQREHPERRGDAKRETRENASQMGPKGRASASERVARGIVGGLAKSRSGKDQPIASLMPADLVAFFVKYYAAPGDVYLDPFMGQGVQLQVAHALGLDYFGYDVSAEFCAYILGVVARIGNDGAKLVAVEGDSRYPTAVPDGIGDFSFHSPPYWDTEYYGDEPGQLGHGQSYEAFLVGMEDVMRAWLPKFKPGAWHVVNVNDFRRDGKYYPYHADTIMLMQRAGWELHDTWIIEGLVGGLAKAFAVDFNLKRIAPKIHEYALVFRKPAGAA